MISVISVSVGGFYLISSNVSSVGSFDLNAKISLAWIIESCSVVNSPVEVKS